MTVLWIGLGAGVGGVARYGLSRWLQGLVETRMPVGTMAVNVVGCFLIGLLASLLTESTLVRPEHRLAILVGLLGGFTTFSSYAWETLGLGRGGFPVAALGHVALSNGLGLLAVWLGWRLSHLWTGA